jgi:hypothetical protein
MDFLSLVLFNKLNLFFFIPQRMRRYMQECLYFNHISFNLCALKLLLGKMIAEYLFDAKVIFKLVDIV